MGDLRKLLLTLGVLFLGMMAFEYYVEDEQDADTGKHTYETRGNYASYKKVTEDSVHYSQKSLYLISNGGKIDATCDNGYTIFIESQNNQESRAFSRLYYTFLSREDYDAALAYMAKKGYRWIINYQFAEEFKGNNKNKITFEDGKTNLKSINSLYLSKMKGAAQ